MATPRSLLVDPAQPRFYHLVSRCVRRAWLCGTHDGRSFEHRRAWIEERLELLAQSFAIEVFAYAIMSNHFHIVAYYDPTAHLGWSDDEVCRRWTHAFPPANGDAGQAMRSLLSDRERLQRCRARLGSLSAFMQHLKQPIAVRANREDGVKGHMFDQRFYSGALLDESAVLAAMAYVDLNPFRAEIANTLEQADYTSVQRRLKALASTPERLASYLEPVLSVRESTSLNANPPSASAGKHHRLNMTLRDYIAFLEQTMADARQQDLSPRRLDEARRWTESARLLRKQQRAYGNASSLQHWWQRTRLRRIEKPLS